MRKTIALLAALMAVLLVACVPPAAAFGEMTGVSMTMTPGEATSGKDMGMVVTLRNTNDRDLIITSLTVQIYNGMFFDPSDEYEMYHINPADAVVPANGTKDFEVPGKAPRYLGACSVAVTIAGLFEGDGEGVDNASIGAFTSSMDLLPDVGGFFLAGALLIIVPFVVVVTVVVIAVWYVSKSKRSVQPGPRCPYCGGVVPPGSSYCPRCRKL